MLLSKDFRRLGDLAGNTVVIYKRQLQKKTAIALQAAYAPKMVLTPKEQQMIINYAERMGDLSSQRAEELASLATPLLDDLPAGRNNPASERLLAIANYLVGRR